MKSKRLLLLGGSMWKDDIRNFATENDIILIATGSNRDSGIFEIADECYDVDSTDTAGMKKLILEKHIDGVYMGGNEHVISVASEYINELGLPCYCTKEQWNLLQNKRAFKDLCLQNGLPVAERYDFDPSRIEDSMATLNFPVITKPADGCGSSGFSICNSIEELKAGIENAKAASVSKEIITEKFVPNSAVVVFYTISDGVAYFSGLQDKYPVKSEKYDSYIGGMFVFDSKKKKVFRERFENKIKQLFKSIGIKEGSIWIEVFNEGESYFFNEVGYRYGGSISIYPVDYFYGYNQVAIDINYALTGQSKLDGFSSLIPKNATRKNHYAIMTVQMNPGVIKEIIGVDKICKKNNVIAFPLRYKVNDRVIESGTFFQSLGLFHFVFDTNEEFEETIKNMLETVKVLDKNGNNMIYPLFNINKDKIKL